MIKTKRAKATLAVTLAILLALTVGTVAFFVDRATHHMEFTTATFTDNGYSLDRTAPVGPFAAGESIDVDIKETNTGAEDIESSIKMTATWSSPDTQLSIFGNAKAEDNAVLTIAGEPLNYEVSADSKSISFTLPDQFLGTESNNKAITRELLLTIPESFVSTGTVTFTFDKVTVSQSPVGFTVDYDNIDLDTLQCSTQVVWAAGKVTSQPNSHKAIYGYLNNDCKGITFQMGFNFNSSVMKDFANTTDAKWTHYSDRVDNITLVEGMSTIGDYAFPNFELVTEIEIPQSVTAIGTYAFDNTGLEDLIIPAAVTKFEAMSFGHCNSLVEITFIGAIGTNIDFPTAGADTGAFYVTPYAEPTNRTKINTTNKDALEYDWVADQRKLLPIMQSWTYDATSDFHKFKDSVTHILFSNSYDLPEGFDTSAGYGPWDVSAAQDKSVMAYMVDGTDTETITYTTTIPKADLPTGTGTLYDDVPVWDGTKFVGNEVIWTGKTTNDWLNGSYAWRYYFVPDSDPATLYEWDTSSTFIKYYRDYPPSQTVVISSNTGWTEDVIANEDSDYICYDFAALRQFNGNYLDTTSVESMRQLFSGCSDLFDLILSTWDVSSVQNFYGMFYDCSSLETVDLDLDFSGIDDANLDKTKDVSIALDWDERHSTISGGLAHMFNGCSSLTAIDTSDWDLTKAESLMGTFNHCEKVTCLDTSNWDVSNIWNFNDTFHYMYALNDIDVSGWDMSNVTTMYSTFELCTELTTLDVGDWDVSNVEVFSCTFTSCEKLKTLDVSEWDVGSATTMNSMFWCCESLESLEVGDWDVSNVIDFYWAFANCTTLTELDVGRWDTSSVQVFYAMFKASENLTTLDVATKVVNPGTPEEYVAWDTSHAYSFGHMFAFCYDLEEVDVSDWVVTELGTDYAGEEKPYISTYLMFMGSKISALSFGPGWDCMDNTLYGMGYLRDITFEHSASDPLILGPTAGVSDGLAYVGYDGTYIKDSPYNANNLLPTTIRVNNQTISDIVNGYAWVEDFRDVTVLGTFTGIEITTPPTKTTYYEGDNFEKAGMVVKAVYNNGVKVEIDDYTVTNGDSLSNGQTSVTISYTEEYSGTTKTATQDITVKPNVQRIDVTTQPTKTTYAPGDNFEKAGMVVTATFNDGSTRDVTAECVIEDGNNLTEGKTTVTVSYTLNGVTVKATVNITVEPATIKITYNANGGAFPDGSTTNEVVFMADSYAVVSGNYEAPTLTDKGLVGWYTDSFCTDGKEFDLSKATGDTTVYAKWVFYPTILPGNTWIGITNDEKFTITSISIVDSYTPSSSDTFLKNADVGNTGEIKVYKNGTKLIIAGNGSGKIYANANSMDMFSHYKSATSITGLDLLDTSRVIDMGWMFYNVMSVTSLDLSSWDTSNVTTMTQMFGNAWSSAAECLLTTIYVSDLWSVEAVTNSDNMFGGKRNGCTHLVGGNGTVYNASYVDSTYACVDKPGQPGYLTYKNSLPSNTLEINYNLNNTFFANNSTTNTVYYSGDLNPATQNRDVIAGTYAEPTVYGEEFYGWYTNAACTDGYEFDLSKATESVTVYAKVSSPKYPVLAPAQTWYKTSYSVSEITSLSIVNNYTSSSYDEVWNADVGNTGSIKVYRVGSDLIMTSNGASKIFANANSYAAFAFGDPSGSSQQRKEFTSITGLDLLDTSAIRDASLMFYSQRNLTSLDLSSWDTSNLQTAFGMFWGCSAVTSLDLSSWDTSNLSSTVRMFQECDNLKTIYVSHSWDASDTLGTTTWMFLRCSSLVGGNGTMWSDMDLHPDAASVKICAHIDGEEGRPGLFTYKAAPAAASVMSFRASGNSLDSINIQ